MRNIISYPILSNFRQMETKLLMKKWYLNFEGKKRAHAHNMYTLNSACFFKKYNEDKMVK